LNPRRRDPDAEPLTDPVACREAALRLLERTRRTRSDLARRLRDKGHAPATVDEVLERLAGVGLVDDIEYARAWLAGRLHRRMSGWRRLEGELRGKGVSADDIAAARAALEEREGVGEGAGDDLSAARKALEQAARRYAKLDERTRRQRLYALLARRGFDGDVIRRALDLSEAGADLDDE
jgi:regulatory protein